jgi:hypothetical protein
VEEEKQENVKKEGKQEKEEKQEKNVMVENPKRIKGKQKEGADKYLF